jgi:outer membrane lipoprotein-sorting protein
MRRASPAAAIGAVLIGFAGMATAGPVPLPRPAPLSKASTGDIPPRPPLPVGAEARSPGPSAQAPARPPAAATAPAPAQTGKPVATAPAQTAKPVVTAQATQAPSIFGAVAGPGGVIAFDAAQRSLVERVNNYMTSVLTLFGDFVQVAADGSRSEGKFYMQKPGRVRFEYDPPSPVELIADGTSVAVRDRRLATQDLYMLSQTPLRFLLADRIDLLKDTNLIGVYADDLFVTLVIEERQVIGGTHRLMLMFGAKDFRLRQWTITDPQGYDTTVALYNLVSGKKLDPNLFTINYERMLQ